MTAIITDLREFRHQGRAASADEMQARGLCDIQDPAAPMPTRCSRCGAQSGPWNPLKMIPVDRSPKMLARAYLYKAICAVGCKGIDR